MTTSVLGIIFGIPWFVWYPALVGFLVLDLVLYYRWRKKILG